MLFQKASEAEKLQRKLVLKTLINFIELNKIIPLPKHDLSKFSANSNINGLNISTLQENPYSGSYQGFQYQFEGEDDLLHLIISKQDNQFILPEEAHPIVEFLLLGMPKGLIWLKPGQYSQHFYFGHDDLVHNVVL